MSISFSVGGGIDIGTLVGHVVADISGLTSGLTRATQHLSSYSAKLNGFMKRNATAMRQIGMRAAIVGGAVVAGLGVAVKNYGEFEQRMRRATAITEFTGEQFLEMSRMAEEASIRFNLTALQTADAFYYLGSAGLTVEEQIKAFPGILALAKAGVMDVGFAAESLVDVMRGTHTSFEETVRVTDILTAAFISSNMNLAQLSEAMSLVASIAADSHTPLNQVAAAFGLMANAGIKGSRAGTALRRAFVNLQDPSSEMREVLRSLNISVYDAEGKMRSFADILVDTRAAIESVTEKQKKHAIITIFGVRAITGIQAILSHTADEYRAYNKQLDESAGATQAVVDKQLAAFLQQMGQIGKQIRVLVRHIGSSLVPAVISLGKWVGELVSKLTIWIDSNRGLVASITLAVASMGAFVLISGITLSLLGNLALVAVATGISFTTLAVGISAATLGIGALVTATAYLVTKIIRTRSEIKRLKKELAMTDAINEIDSYIKKIEKMVTAPGPLNALLGKFGAVKEGLEGLRKKALYAATASRKDLITMYKVFDMEIPDVYGTGIAKATSILRENMLKQIEYSRDMVIQLGKEGIEEFNKLTGNISDATVNAIKDISDAMNYVPEAIQRVLDELDLELKTLGIISEERERANRIAEFQIQLEDEIRTGTEWTNSELELANRLMGEFKLKLDKVVEGAREFPIFAKAIGQWASDATNIWARLGDVITNALDGLSDSLANMLMQAEVDWTAFARKVLTDLASMAIKAQLVKVGSVIGGFFGATKDVTIGMGGAALTTAAGVLTTAGATLTTAATALITAASTLSTSAAVGAIPGLQHGGEVLKTGLAVVHEGETYSGTNGGRSDIAVNVYPLPGETANITRRESSLTKQDVIDISIEAASVNGSYQRSHKLRR